MTIADETKLLNTSNTSLPLPPPSPLSFPTKDELSKPLIETRDNVNVVEPRPVKKKKVVFIIDPPIYINGTPIYGEYTLGTQIRLGNNLITITEDMMKEFLSRASQAAYQETRIYKDEGMRIDIDEKTGITRITRKL